MTEMIIGMVGAGMGIVLFVSGFLLGGKRAPGKHCSREHIPAADNAAGAERKHLIAEQHAFETLMGYSADVAYGTANMTAGEDDT